MWHNRTLLQQQNKVAAGRAAAADVPALTLLKSISTRSSGACSDAAQVFTPTVCAAAAAAGHVHVLQWLRYAAHNSSRTTIMREPQRRTSGGANLRCTYVCTKIASAQHHCIKWRYELCL
jgi:hypothetical protein